MVQNTKTSTIAPVLVNGVPIWVKPPQDTEAATKPPQTSHDFIYWPEH